MWIVIICWSSCDVIILRFTLPFWSSRFLYVTKKSRQILNILRTKRAFKVKRKVFFIIFKGLSLKQIRQILWKVRVQLSFINWLITDRWPTRLLTFLKWRYICSKWTGMTPEQLLTDPYSMILIVDFIMLRSSRRQLFYKKGILKYFAKFTENYQCWSLF